MNDIPVKTKQRLESESEFGIKEIIQTIPIETKNIINVQVLPTKYQNQPDNSENRIVLKTKNGKLEIMVTQYRDKENDNFFVTVLGDDGAIKDLSTLEAISAEKVISKVKEILNKQKDIISITSHSNQSEPMRMNRYIDSEEDRNKRAGIITQQPSMKFSDYCNTKNLAVDLNSLKMYNKYMSKNNHESNVDVPVKQQRVN